MTLSHPPGLAGGGGGDAALGDQGQPDTWEREREEREAAAEVTLSHMPVAAHEHRSFSERYLYD
ncbi:hypothetical protein KIPB_016790, partial [Kipferlia bialata]|eukprot:g16790.t1